MSVNGGHTPAPVLGTFGRKRLRARVTAISVERRDRAAAGVKQRSPLWLMPLSAMSPCTWFTRKVR